MIRSRRLFLQVSAFTACATALLPAPETRGQRSVVLHIGASKTLTPSDWTDAQEAAALKSLENFIRDQTGMANTITHNKTWQIVLDKMEKGSYEVAVLAGYEYAWAQARYPKLRPLALAVSGPRYSVISLVTNARYNAADFASLRGQTLAVPPSGQDLARRFVAYEAKVAGYDLGTYFPKVVKPANTEDALDAIVDGEVQVAAVDRIGLEAYKRRKPGRYRHLKEIAHSPPFLPVVVAYYDHSLDARTLNQFRDGLIGANRKPRGEILLTMFRLTKFDEIPSDFGQMLNEARKTYPPDADK